MINRVDLERDPLMYKVKTHHEVVVDYIRSCTSKFILSIRTLLKLWTSVKIVAVLVVLIVVWCLSCAQVGPGRQTDHGYSVPTTWPNMSQCFGYWINRLSKKTSICFQALFYIKSEYKCSTSQVLISFVLFGPGCYQNLIEFIMRRNMVRFLCSSLFQYQV